MTAPQIIPQFSLIGDNVSFPDVAHYEQFADRAEGLDWVVPPHRHKAMAQVFHFDSGGAEVVIESTKFSTNGRSFLYIPSGAVHGMALEPGLRGGVLSFPSAVLAAVGPRTAELTKRLDSPFIGEVDTQLNGLFAQFAQVFESEPRFRAPQLLGLSILILAALAASGDPVGPALKGSTLAALDTLIAQHRQDGWGPSDYANALNMTTGHLSRLCRTASGMPVSRYVEAQLMTEAARLLAFTQQPVAEVGYGLGFDDPAYFSRRFRLAQGEPPSAYRARFVGH